MANPSTQPPIKPNERKKSFKETFKSSMEKFKTNENLENVVSYATSRTRDTISYVALIIGIILLFFYPIYGGILIGLIVGFYFSSEILAFLQTVNDWIDEEGIVKSLIAGGLILALFISAPAIFVGIALAVAIRHVLFPEISKKQ